MANVSDKMFTIFLIHLFNLVKFFEHDKISLT